MQSLGLESRTDTVGCLRTLVSVYIYIYIRVCAEIFLAERAREHVQQMTKQLGEKQKDQRAAGRERERETLRPGQTG